MPIRLSYSQYDKYCRCPKMYEYSRLYKSRVFNINFFIGNIIHEGLHLTYARDQDLFEKLNKFFEESLEKERKNTMFSPETEQKIVEWRVIIIGMIYAYNMKYTEFMNDHELVHNEKEYIVDLGDGVTFLIKLDNILKNKANRHLVHEVKTTRQLNEQYVYDIQYKVQPACYYYFGRMVGEFDPAGIVYDVLQKPSIRVKKGEEYVDYLDRLEEYYQKDPHAHLHMEKIDQPIIKEVDLIKSIKMVARRIENKEFEKTWKDCGKCEFRKPCFGDDAPEYLLAFERRS